MLIMIKTEGKSIKPVDHTHPNRDGFDQMMADFYDTRDAAAGMRRLACADCWPVMNIGIEAAAEI